MSTFRPYLFSALFLGAAALVPASAAEARPNATGADESAMSDAQSLGVAQAASYGEVELSGTAASRARSEVVLKLARLTLDDHGDAVQKALALGEKLHLRAAPSATSNGLRTEANDATSHLENATPAAFDRTYVEGAIRFHQTVLNAIDETAPRTNSREVKALFEDVRARVAHELDMARSALASLRRIA